MFCYKRTIYNAEITMDDSVQNSFVKTSLVKNIFIEYKNPQ